MSKVVEEIQIKVRTAICQLSEASLREICAGLHIEVKETDTGRLALIQILTKYLDAEELGTEALTNLREAIKEKKPATKDAKSEQESGVKTEQIGNSRQKDRLSFTSLAHQINAGLKRGYKEEEIVEAVIRAINPGLRLRSYLEGRPDLELARLRKILRSHYQERGATEMYQLLSSAVQEAGETPQDFLVRLLDLKQKVMFASQEAGSDLKYDPKLVQCMFLHSLLTGLRNDSIKMEIKLCLQNTQVEDEERFEKLSAAVCNETERMQKLGSRHDQPTNMTPTQLVAQVATHDDSHASVEGKTPEKPPKVNLLTEVRELKAELAAIREGMEQQSRASPHPQYNLVKQGRVRPRGCWNCERQGRGFRSNHCFNCGDAGHFSYQCQRSSRRGYNSANPQGNRPGLPSRDKEQPARFMSSPNSA
ncbi:hypothetical protein ACROYT_G017864 [Oculina patagonica]